MRTLNQHLGQFVIGLICLVTVLTCNHLLAQTTSVELRSVARITTSEFTLADVAKKIKGDQAATLGQIALGSFDNQDARNLTMNDIRKKMNDAKVNWGEVSLRGPDTIQLKWSNPATRENSILARPEPVVNFDEAEAFRKTGPQTNITYGVRVPVNTLRGPLVVRRSAKRQRVGDLITDALLKELAPYQVTEVELGASVRLLESIELIDGKDYHISFTRRPAIGMITASVIQAGQYGVQRVRLQVRAKMPLVAARHQIQKGQTIEESDVETRLQWVESMGKSPYQKIASVIGTSAKTRIDYDHILEANDVTQPLAVLRGESISVYSSKYPIMRWCEAKEDGVIGQVIKVYNKKMGGYIMVKVTGDAEAMIKTNEPAKGEKMNFKINRQWMLVLVVLFGVSAIELHAQATASSRTANARPATAAAAEAPVRSGLTPPHMLNRSRQSKPLTLRDMRGTVLEVEARTFKEQDIITIIINEKSNSTIEATLETEKEANIKGAIKGFPHFVLADLLNGRLKNSDSPDKFPAIDISTSRDFEGEGEQEKKHQMSTTLAATVLAVKPNGNLVLEASKSIQIDKEIMVIKVTGTCRTLDIDAVGNVLSTKMANFTVNMKHGGEIGKATEKGMFTKVWDYLSGF